MATTTELTNGLSRGVLAELQAVFARYPTIERVLLFGSRATGFAKPGSDIDLAVIAPRMSQREFSRLWNELEDLPLVYTLDILHWDQLAQEALKDKILTEGKVLYGARGES
ncbi:MAG: nucleotidyltransferase domain-containing protein [Candidatus Binatia bacterium]